MALIQYSAQSLLQGVGKEQRVLVMQKMLGLEVLAAARQQQLELGLLPDQETPLPQLRLKETTVEQHLLGLEVLEVAVRVD